MSEMNVHFWTDWEPMFRRDQHWNWIDFTVITIAFERAYYVDRFDATFGLLGFCVNIEFNWQKETA